MNRSRSFGVIARASGDSPAPGEVGAGTVRRLAVAPYPLAVPASLEYERRAANRVTKVSANRAATSA